MKIAPDTLYQSENTKYAFEVFKTTLKSEKTQNLYKDTLRNFCNFVEKDLLEINENDVKRYKEYMEGKKLSDKTIYSRISMLSSFVDFIIIKKELIEPDHLDINVFDKIERPYYSVYVQPSQIPSLEELDKIYSAAICEGEMYYCVVLLASRCALTREEIINLKLNNFIKDTNGKNGIMFRNQYGNRFIKVPEDVLGIINNYVSKVRINHGPYLFYNSRGSILKSNTISKKITDIIEQALGSKKYSLQSLRDFAVTTMLVSGASESSVSNYISIGQEWIQRYTKVVEEFVMAPCDLVNIRVIEKKKLGGI